MEYSYRAVWGSNDGVRIEALEWTPASESVQGLPLVMIPGGSGTAWNAEIHGHAAALGRLGSLRRRVLGVSRRGTGLSDAPPSGYRPGDFAGDARSVVTAAGYDRFVLFGHSMGVPISLDFALRYPGGLAALILGDAPPRYIDFKADGTFASMLDPQRPYEFATWDEAFGAMTNRTADAVVDRERFDRFRHRMFLQQPDGRVRLQFDRAALMRTVEESVAAQTDYTSRLRSIRCPVLLLVATEGWSPLTPEALQTYEQQEIDLSVVRLPTNHGLGQWSDPTALHAALGTFLDRVDSTERP